MRSPDRALDTGNRGRRRGLRLHRDRRDQAVLRDGGANGDRVWGHIDGPALLDTRFHGAEAGDNLGSRQRGAGDFRGREGLRAPPAPPLAGTTATERPARIRIQFPDSLGRSGSALVTVGAAVGAGFAAVVRRRSRAAAVHRTQTTAITNQARTSIVPGRAPGCRAPGATVSRDVAQSGDVWTRFDFRSVTSS